MPLMLSLARNGLVPNLTRRFSRISCKQCNVSQTRARAYNSVTSWRWKQGRSPSLQTRARAYNSVTSWRWKQGRSLSLLAQRRWYAAYPPLRDYETEKKQFKLEVPARFNFARDVIDKWAQDELTGKRSTSLPAFWWISSQKPELKWSFQDISRLSKRVANILTGACGLSRGDTVIVILPRIPEWWLINIAAIRAGILLVSGTTLLRASDVKYRLLASEAKCIITNSATVDQVEQVAGESPHLICKVLVGPKTETRPGWLNFNQLDEKSTDSFECVDTRSDEPMSVFFTSGTTGTPKMTEHTHASYGIGHALTTRYFLNIGQEDIMWNISDTGWAKAAYSNVFAPWIAGSCVFIDEMEQKVDPERILKVLSQYPVSHMCNAPTTMRTLVKFNLRDIRLMNLQLSISAGEPVNPELKEAWEAGTGLTLYEGYGQTETTVLCSTLMGSREESMGKSLPGVDLQIVDDDGNVVPRGTEGNIGIRCKPNKPVGLFSRYVNDPKQTASCFLGDFYTTGDRGLMDEEDFIFFVGRADDVIISSGYRIGPFEVESALLTHPAVLESAAVSSPDEIRGEIVTAFVIRTPKYESMDEATLTKELQNHVKTVTAPYKYPRKIVFVKELPKTVSGKIRRIELRMSEWNRAKKNTS